MRKFFYLLIALTLFSTLAAISNEQVATRGNSVSYSYEMSRDDERPNIISKTFAIPATQAELFVNSARLVTYDNDNNVVDVTRNVGEDIVFISNSFQMRDMYGFTVHLIANQDLRSGYQVLEAVDFELRATNSVELPTEVSEAFLGSYKKLAVNFADSYLVQLPVAQPKMLIVSPSSSLDTYTNFYKRWKQASGFDVGVIQKDASWISSNIVKQHIASYYDEHRPDYILIIGDTAGSFSIPTNMFLSPDGTENDADDNFYTLLEGDDYFPDAMIGRFSIGDPVNLLTQVSKTIGYEKATAMGPDANTDWMKKSLIVAGNYAENNLQPSTPIRMSRWVREQFLENGFTHADTVFYPPSFPGTSLIEPLLTSGVQYVSYRGWGDANGWHYPHFHMGDLAVVNNINKLPIVYSIVCNTGDFANSVNPSFGEFWMRMGSSANHRGCVAFVGPSDLHTKTKFNNAISTGMFSSFLQKDNRIFSTTVLDGKIELYNNYPLDRADNGYVPFYFHVYNMLCDPSLKMWVLVPDEINVTGIPSALDRGTSYLELTFPAGMEDAIVTTTKDQLVYEYVRVKNGRAIVPIDTDIEGEQVKLTITKANYRPLLVDIPVTTNSNIGITHTAISSGNFQPGYSCELVVDLMNYGTDYQNVVATLSSSNPNVTITTDMATLGDINSGATSSLTYNLEVAPDAEFAEVADFSLAFSQSNNTEKFSKTMAGAFVSYVQHSGELLINEANQLQITFRNVGNNDLASGTVRVRSLHNGVNNGDVTVDYGSASVNNITTVTISPAIAGNATPGAQIPFRFDFTEALTNYSITQFVVIPISGVQATHPTGPDRHGYYAYGSNDTAYPAAPTYEWIDVDPQEGGAGTLRIIGDDDSYVQALPFTFRYYGQDFNEITICSNGWMSFGATWYVNFSNSAIPSALGPKYQVCPNWDDLKGLQTSQGVFANMRASTYYDEANNRFIIEWNDTYTQTTIDQFADAALQKFQVVLEPLPDEDGDITFHYHTFSNPSTTSNYATVGIMNGNRDDGIQYTFANMYPESAMPVSSGFALKFTKTPPDNFVSNENDAQAPQTYLNQNFPNPFNPETTISFNLSNKNKLVELSVYNVKGQLVKTLLKGELEQGRHSLVWNGTNNKEQTVASGVYYYKLKTDAKTFTNKMILMK
ncbi:MAG: C25 family cysteine peptidase [Candidatus Cloacimonadales bacterium]